MNQTQRKRQRKLAADRQRQAAAAVAADLDLSSAQAGELVKHAKHNHKSLLRPRTDKSAYMRYRRCRPGRKTDAKTRQSVAGGVSTLHLQDCYRWSASEGKPVLRSEFDLRSYESQRNA